MTVVSPNVRLVTERGHLTPEGVRLLQELLVRTESLLAAQAAQETTIADHEARITALE